MEYTDIIFNVLASIGGISGIIYFYKWVRNRKARIMVLSSSSEYHISQDDLIIHTKLQIANKREEAVYITDVLALLKEDPAKTKDNKGHVYSKRPTNPVFSPTKLEGKSATELNFEFNFSNIDIHPIKRVGIANFLGFLGGRIPVVIAKESDFDEKWDQLPLEMKLIMHINGKEIISSTQGVFLRGTTDRNYGTLSAVQIAQIERDYLLKKDKTG